MRVTATRFLVLPAACLSLTMFGSGCGNANVNESGSTGVTGASQVSGEVKPSEPPPSNYKEFYEREQKQNALKKGGAAKKTGGATK